MSDAPDILSLDAIAADPSIALDLTDDDRRSLLLRAAGLLAALGAGLGGQREQPGVRQERLLTATDVSKMLGYRPSYIYELGRTRQIRSVRVGKYVRFPMSAVEEFIRENGTPLDEQAPPTHRRSRQGYGS